MEEEGAAGRTGREGGGTAGQGGGHLPSGWEAQWAKWHAEGAERQRGRSQHEDEEDEVGIACAVEESMGWVKRCFVCGVKAPFPRTLPAESGCPNVSCQLNSCYEKLHCMWLEIRRDLAECVDMCA